MVAAKQAAAASEVQRVAALTRFPQPRHELSHPICAPSAPHATERRDRPTDRLSVKSRATWLSTKHAVTITITVAVTLFFLDLNHTPPPSNSSIPSLPILITLLLSPSPLITPAVDMLKLGSPCSVL